MLQPLDELQTNVSLRHRLFPITEQQIFFAHAGVSPLPSCVVEAIVKQAHLGSIEQQESDYHAVLDRARRAGAALCGVSHQEVSLVGPTTLALSLVATGLDWKSGDEVVYYPDDYPANVYPWIGLESKGVKAIPILPKRYGQITAADIESRLTSRTRLVTVSSAHFLSGFRPDLQQIGQMVHGAGALFCVDAIQTLGACPTPLDHVDFAAADSHKWMLGPVGAGLLIVREAVADLVRPLVLGVGNIKTRRFIASEKIEWVRGSERFEAGSMNLVGIAGMRAGLEMLSEWGLMHVHQRIDHLRERIRAGLRSMNFEILGDEDSQACSGITTASHSQAEAADLVSALAREGCVASARWDRQNRAWLRLAPHVYNTDEEVDHVLDCLRRHLPL